MSKLMFGMAATAMLIAGTSHAAEWDVAASPVRYGGDPLAVAEAHLRSLRGPRRLERVELVALRVLPSAGAYTVRYAQRHAGLPVLGAQAAVRVGPDGSARAVVMQLARDLQVSPVPSVDEPSARGLVASYLGLPSVASLRTLLAVLPDGEGGRLVWQVDVPSLEGGYRLVLDAHSGEVISERSLAVHALGRVYPISSVTTPQTQDLELLELDAATPQRLNGWNGNLSVVNYVSGSPNMGGLDVEQTLEPSSGEDFLYDPPADPTDTTDAFAQVGLYFHLTRMRQFFASTLGLDMSDPSWRLAAVANIRDNGAPVDNAFFSPMGLEPPFDAPNMVGVGQGSTFDFAQDSDVFNHEMTHYVMHNAVGYNGGQAYSDEYGLSPFSASIDEGLSDYFACTVNGDPTLGEASLALLSAARDLTDTSKRCPDDILGEVHEDGEIIGSFAWTLRDRLGAEVADELVFGAATLLTFGASFGDFTRAIQQTADDMVSQGTLSPADRQQIDAALEERGLDECDREIPLRKEQPRTSITVGLDLIGQLFGANCAAVKGFGVSMQTLFHYVVTPDPSDEGVRLSVQVAPMTPGELSWNIYVRKNEHVSFASQGFFPQVADYDYALEAVAGTSAELVIDAGFDPPFDPNATYHMVVAHQNCPLAEITASTSGVEPPMGTGGAGGAGGGPVNPAGDTVVEDGCACRAAGAPRSYGAWALALGALGLGLRRRRGRGWASAGHGAGRFSRSSRSPWR